MVAKSLFTIFMFIYFPILSIGQGSVSKNSKWEVDFGYGLYMAFLTKDDYTGSDVSVGGYHLDMSYHSGGWLFSPVIRYMPYHTLIGESGTSHNEIGLRGGYLKDLENRQFRVLLGVSYMFGDAYGSRRIEVPKTSGTGTQSTWTHLNENYEAVGLTSEFRWTRKLGKHFLAGVSLPVSISSWYVIVAPHATVGYRW